MRNDTVGRLRWMRCCSNTALRAYTSSVSPCSTASPQGDAQNRSPFQILHKIMAIMNHCPTKGAPSPEAHHFIPSHHPEKNNVYINCTKLPIDTCTFLTKFRFNARKRRNLLEKYWICGTIMLQDYDNIGRR